MQIKIKCKNINLNSNQKANIQTKIEKLGRLADRLNDSSAEFRAEISYTKSRSAEDAFCCQLTIFAPGDVVRAEAKQNSVENAVDECMDKIKSQIERYKAKIHRSGKKSSPAAEASAPANEEFEMPKILRRKRFSDTKPISEDSAIDKMELVGHDFLLFNNADTDRFSVVYKRKDGYYGIIEPKLETD